MILTLLIPIPCTVHLPFFRLSGKMAREPFSLDGHLDGLRLYSALSAATLQTLQGLSSDDDVYGSCSFAPIRSSIRLMSPCQAITQKVAAQ